MSGKNWGYWSEVKGQESQNVTGLRKAKQNPSLSYIAARKREGIAKHSAIVAWYNSG